MDYLPKIMDGGSSVDKGSKCCRSSAEIDAENVKMVSVVFHTLPKDFVPKNNDGEI